MDMRIWKKVILQWVTECNFVDHNYFNIEQINIDAFYQKFSAHHKIASEFSTLQSLLEAHYPEFKPHVDDENALSSTEYIYIFSLLLHFCCVKCPEEQFHVICKKLSEQMQQSIAIFFKQLMECSTINKEYIRQSIAEVGGHTLVAPQKKCETNSNISITSSNSANSNELQTSFSNSSIRLNGDQSPTSTPNRKTLSTAQRISPDTPKSSLLEERTRELYNYKALLETERYEKNMLELQITQNEKQIQSMVQIHENLRQQIQQLKDELLTKSIEPSISDHEVDDDALEAVRQELCKKVNQKEQENFRLYDTISTLREENNLVESKLRLAESKLSTYRDCIQELEMKLEELTLEIQKKDITIKTLTDDKADLEHFIAETRSASGSSRPNFDSSVDCLDASFSRYTNSSGSLGSPENLGATVIDIQLREKEHENTQLREELTELRTNQNELIKLIQQKTQSCMQEFSFELNNNDDIKETKQENNNISNDNNNDALMYFNCYVSCTNHLGKSFIDAKNQIQKLENDILAMTTDFRKLKENSEIKNATCMQEIENLQQLKQELAINYENSIDDYEKRLEQSNSAHFELKNLYEILTEHVNNLESCKTNLEKQVETVTKQSNDYELECNKLNEELKQQNIKLEQHMEAERLVKENYEKSLIEIEDLRSKLRESDAHLETVRTNIFNKEVELGELGKKIIQIGKNNVELEDKVNKLTTDYKHVCSKYDAEIQRLRTEELDLQKSLDKQQKQIDSMTSTKEADEQKLEKICELLRMSITEIDEIDFSICLDGVHYAIQKLLSEKQKSKEQLQQIETEKINLKRQYELEMENLQQQLKDVELKIETYKTANNELELVVEKAKITTEKMLQEIQNLKSEQKFFEEKQKQAENQVQLLSKEIDKFMLEIQTLQAEKVNLIEKQKEAENEWLDKQQQLQAELSGEIEKLIQNTQNLKIEKETLAKQYEEAIKLQTKVHVDNEKLKFDLEQKENANKILLEQQQSTENNWLEKQATWQIELQTEKSIKEKKNEELQILKEQLEQFEFTTNALQVEHTEILNSNLELEQKFSNELEAKKALQLKFEDLQTDNCNLKTQISALELQIENLTAKLNLEIEINATKAAEAAKLLEASSLTIEKLQTTLDDLKKQENMLNEQLKIEKQTQEEYKEQILFVENELKIYKEKQEQTTNVYEEKLLSSNEKNQALINENEKLASEIQSSKTVLKTIESNLLQANESIQKLTKDLELKNELVTTRNLKLEESQEMLNLASEKLEKKVEIINSLQATYDEHVVKLQELKTKNEKEIQSLKESAILQQHTIEEQSKQIVKLLEQKKLLESEKEEYVESQIDLKTQIEQVSLKQQLAEKQNTHFKQTLAEKEARIKELCTIMLETEKCLKAVNHDSENLQKEFEFKELEMQKLKQELSLTKDELTMFIDMLNNITESLEKGLIAETSPFPPLFEFDLKQSSLQHLKQTLKQLFEKQQQIMKLIQTQNEFLNSDKLILEHKLKTTENRVQSNLENLEAVNEKLSEENATLQLTLANKETDLKTLQNQFGALKALNERLTKAHENIEAKQKQNLEKIKTEKENLNSKLQAEELKYQKLQKDYDDLQLEASEAETSAQQHLTKLEKELAEVKNSKSILELEISKKTEECNTLATKCTNFETSNAEMETKVTQLKKDGISLRVELSEMSEKYERLNDDVNSYIQQLEAANLERHELQAINVKNQTLQNELQALQQQLNDVNTEIETQAKQYKASLNEREKLNENLTASKRENHELQTQLNDLKQKIALNNLEKDDLKREMELLRKQVEINSRYQTTSESKLKNIIETSQALERNLLSSENALKTMRAKLTQNETNIETLNNENQKLRDSSENLNKRLEKYALKLGETQAQCSKFERDNEKLNKQLEIRQENLESIQREKDTLQNENKTLKEQLNKLTQISNRLQLLEKTNSTLIAEKKTLENTELDLKAQIRKLESSLKINEERLRKMKYDNERNEQETVKLNYQIGALNSEIQILKNSSKTETNTIIAELQKQLQEACKHTEIVEKNNNELEKRHIEVKNQLENVTNKLSKTVLALEISKRSNTELEDKLEQKKNKIEKLQITKNDIEKAQKNLTERLKDSQNFSDELLKHKHDLEIELATAQAELINKNTTIATLRLELNESRLSTVESNAAVSDKTSALVAEIESLRAQLKANEEMLQKEQDITAKLRVDNQILQAKYRDAKQRLETETENSEERIKENRLELEGKLEKMKNKMKVLYTEEVGKMKAKQERETAALKSELESLKSENSKYDAHVRKLSTELMTLNERMLECQKENTYLLTKLKYIQNEDTKSTFKRPNTSSAVSTTSQSSSSASCMPRVSGIQPIHTNIGTDLAMEDEQGEMFNNTYLADLKNGRISSDVCPEELMHRNSLLPPHLKSSYAPQYDHGLCEDEVKDGQSLGLDDSTSVLLTSNTSCSRKKISGVTHYRKPGPPTPSKNGGRLSFGGSFEPAREILKESYDDNAHGGSIKTPARFGFFTSRFSMGNTNLSKDEPQAQVQEQPQQQQALQISIQTPNCNNIQDLRRVIHKRNFENQNILSVERVASVTKILTSTPRPNKVRGLFEKRRLINEIQKTASSTTPSHSENETHDITPPELSLIETPPERRTSSLAAKCLKRRKSIFGVKRIKPLKTETNRSSIGVKVAELQRRIRRRVRRERPSICVQKNIYASKSCTPQRGAQRDLNRYLGHRDRCKNFDLQRGLLNVSTDDDTETETDEASVRKPIAMINVINDATYEVDNIKKEIQNNETEDYVDDDEDEEDDDIDYEMDYEVSEPPEEIDGATYNVNNIESVQIVTVIQSEEEMDNETIGEPIQDNQERETVENIENQNDKSLDTVDVATYSRSLHFEQLLKQTASEAPFNIDSLRLSPCKINDAASIEIATCKVIESTSVTTTSQSIENLSSKSQNSHSALVPLVNTPTTSQHSQNTHLCVTPTPHCSTSISPSQSMAAVPPSLLQHSRTIYGASVIFNRRIPNVDAVQVRKSSIYFKNPKCSTFRASCNLNAIDTMDTQTTNVLSQDGDLILVTNQTITILDLIFMWQQMSLGTRIFVSTTLIGFIAAFISLFFMLFSGS